MKIINNINETFYTCTTSICYFSHSKSSHCLTVCIFKIYSTIINRGQSWRRPEVVKCKIENTAPTNPIFISLLLSCIQQGKQKEPSIKIFRYPRDAQLSRLAYWAALLNLALDHVTGTKKIIIIIHYPDIEPTNIAFTTIRLLLF